MPIIPIIRGMSHVPTVFHSSLFKEKSQFGVDKDVLIVGTGETGMDLAYLAIQAPTKSVTLCHRDGFHSVSKASSVLAALERCMSLTLL